MGRPAVRRDLPDARGDFDFAPLRVAPDDEGEADYAGSVNGGGSRLSFLNAHDGSFAIRVQ